MLNMVSMKRFKNLDLGASKYEVTALGVKGYNKNVTIRGDPGGRG